MVVAAGNENQDIDKDCNQYPSCYDNRIVTVGNLLPDGYYPSPAGGDVLKQHERNPLSNYGNYVKHWEVGANADGKVDWSSGTSQATAITTGKLVRAK
jgi:hypothetical protein